MMRLTPTLMLLAVTTVSAQTTKPNTVGRPLTDRFPTRTLPEPTMPGERPVAPKPTAKPRNVVYVPAPYGYYYDYGYRQTRPQDVTVNVTNVIQQPAPVAYAPVISVADAAAYFGARGPARYWGSEAGNAEERVTLVEGRPPRDVDLIEPARADVASLDAIVAAYYDVQSGPRGTPRNWDRFSSLFASDARLTRVRGEGADRRPSVMTPDDYRSIVTIDLEQGVFAREVSRKVEQFGSVAQVFSTYEYRRMATDSTAFARGINSLQLMNDGTRWWITSVSWDEERANNRIPAKYLPTTRSR
ncbi:MAG TPA: hypothetical protein VJR92_02825 [Gemmatimonadaceae bacterium]|nr:hypothetical protein [Gemmatimonadaceae bacterium]